MQNLKLVIFGDGNGNKGLIRRVDHIEHRLGVLAKQNWAIILLLASLWMERILAAVK